MSEDNIRYKLTETYMENFSTDICDIGMFDTPEAARSAMRDRIIKAFKDYGLGDPLDEHDPVSVRQLERIDDPDGNAHEDEFGCDFRVSDSYAWANVDSQAQMQWDIEEISPIRRHMLVRGNIPPKSAKPGHIGLSATQYDDFGEAYANMVKALLETCCTDDLEKLVNRFAAKKIENGDSYMTGEKRDPRFPEYYSESTGFYLGMSEARVSLDYGVPAPVSFKIFETLAWPD